MIWQTFAMVLSTLAGYVWRRRRAEPSVDLPSMPPPEMLVTCNKHLRLHPMAGMCQCLACQSKGLNGLRNAPTYMRECPGEWVEQKQNMVAPKEWN
jgi:hypothetical protein